MHLQLDSRGTPRAVPRRLARPDEVRQVQRALADDPLGGTVDAPRPGRAHRQSHLPRQVPSAAASHPAPRLVVVVVVSDGVERVNLAAVAAGRRWMEVARVVSERADAVARVPSDARVVRVVVARNARGVRPSVGSANRTRGPRASRAVDLRGSEVGRPRSLPPHHDKHGFVVVVQAQALRRWHRGEEGEDGCRQSRGSVAVGWEGGH